MVKESVPGPGKCLEEILEVNGSHISGQWNIINEYNISVYIEQMWTMLLYAC